MLSRTSKNASEAPAPEQNTPRSRQRLRRAAGCAPPGGAPKTTEEEFCSLGPVAEAFIGRQAELIRLLELGDAGDCAGGSGAVVISAIDGMAGIGKTAMAVHAAHRRAGRFGDGQLFIDMHE